MARTFTIPVIETWRRWTKIVDETGRMTPDEAVKIARESQRQSTVEMEFLGVQDAATPANPRADHGQAMDAAIRATEEE